MKPCPLSASTRIRVGGRSNVPISSPDRNVGYLEENSTHGQKRLIAWQKLRRPRRQHPSPLTLEEGLGILAFIDNGALFAAKLDLARNPPQLVSEAIQLTDMVNVQNLSISPDGRRIAFISGFSEANNLNVVNTDGQDLRTLLISSELPIDIEPKWYRFGRVGGPDSVAARQYNIGFQQCRRQFVWTRHPKPGGPLDCYIGWRIDTAVPVGNRRWGIRPYDEQ